MTIPNDNNQEIVRRIKAERRIKYKERHESWLYASAGFYRAHSHFVFYIRGLGDLDVELIDRNTQLFSPTIQHSKNQDSAIDESMEHMELITLSHLWVLGAYEVIRCICENTKDARNSYSRDEITEIDNAKSFFERIRIPLAKLEPSRKCKKTDLGIAYPVVNPMHGIAWHVSDNFIISRKELADNLMQVGLKLNGNRLN